MTEVRRRRADKGGAICEMGGDRIGQGGRWGHATRSSVAMPVDRRPERSYGRCSCRLLRGTQDGHL